MRIRKIRVRKEYRLKFRLFLFIVFSLCFIFLPQSNRALMASFFSTKCRNTQQVFSRRLDDRLPEYAAHVQATGIAKCSNEKDLFKRIAARQLFRVKSGKYYKIEDLEHSYPYLTRDGRKLLHEIGRRYRRVLRDEGLKGSKFIVTSMTRTTEGINGLGRTNINASDNSPHLTGTAFDISYANFSIMKYKVTECDKWYMKEALAQVIYQLKQEKKCWATYERKQGCFHVVAR